MIHLFGLISIILYKVDRSCYFVCMLCPFLEIFLRNPSTLKDYTKYSQPHVIEHVCKVSSVMKIRKEGKCFQRLACLFKAISFRKSMPLWIRQKYTLFDSFLPFDVSKAIKSYRNGIAFIEHVNSVGHTISRFPMGFGPNLKALGAILRAFQK